MTKRPFIVFGFFALICIVAVPWIALGKNGDQDAATVTVAPRDQDAKDLFATNCGPCHTLAAAGTDGVVGPNLDQLLVPSGINSAESFQANAGRVMQAVTCGVEGRMPKGILEEEEAKQVATFVGAYAGQIGKGPVVDTDDVKPPELPSCS
jgi:mono/diheme cytochrome c family protein